MSFSKWGQVSHEQERGVGRGLALGHRVQARPAPQGVGEVCKRRVWGIAQREVPDSGNFDNRLETWGEKGWCALEYLGIGNCWHTRM